MRFIVYALLCPKCGCPRYVGKSTKGIQRIAEHRKSLHEWDGKNHWDGSRHKVFWVRSLLEQGLTFDYVILTFLPSGEQLDEAERYWIQFFRERGCPLTNITDGGDGTSGWKQSPETIAKRIAHFRGRTISPEMRARISATLKLKKDVPGRFKKGIPLTGKLLETHARTHAIPPFQDQHGRIYKTLKEAAERWNLKSSNICHVLKGRRKSSGGLVFTFIPQ